MNFYPYEEQLSQRDILRVAGIDEAGRGPLAGPVVAAAVIFGDRIPPGLNDSKKLTPSKRDTLYDDIVNSAIDYGLGVVDQKEIDRINVLQATVVAMKKAIGALNAPPEFLLVDGNYLPKFIYPAKSITKGDECCRSVAAASILAKVTRDRLLVDIAPFFPEYGFENHKGYGTRQHLDAILEYGPTPFHRLTFGGVREHLPKLRTEKAAIGKWGEDYACYYLWKKGATLIKRNFRAGRDAELDIIVMWDGRLRFVEVKTAGVRDYASPDQWVDSTKQEKIFKASELFLYHHDEYTDIPCQFDLVAIQLKNENTMVSYYENAFEM